MELMFCVHVVLASFSLSRAVLLCGQGGWHAFLICKVNVKSRMQRISRRENFRVENVVG